MCIRDRDVNATVSEQMDAYGFTLVSTLITKIALPAEVEDSMNPVSYTHLDVYKRQRQSERPE